MPNKMYKQSRAFAVTTLLAFLLTTNGAPQDSAQMLQKDIVASNLKATNNVTDGGSRGTVKKALQVSAEELANLQGANYVEPPPAETPHNDKPADKVAIINGHPAQQEQPLGKTPVDEVHIQLNEDFDFPETYTAVFYILVGISTSALLLFIFRVYRLRLSRAERKYGVQGDRANQELTPLPMAIEDVNSDEEDHTLFEVNRQNIRIL